MTVTLCIDRNVNWRPGVHVNRVGPAARPPLRSVRVWWLWFAVGWYRFDDHELVVWPHTWDEQEGNVTDEALRR